MRIVTNRGRLFCHFLKRATITRICFGERTLESLRGFKLILRLDCDAAATTWDERQLLRRAFAINTPDGLTVRSLVGGRTSAHRLMAGYLPSIASDQTDNHGEW